MKNRALYYLKTVLWITFIQIIFFLLALTLIVGVEKTIYILNYRLFDLILYTLPYSLIVAITRFKKN
ncbi:hypothetical protein I568_01327 [Enterococcus columbae DSM 7374 = ATCC 51263]|uniref:Uncharacterized protein n=1 Tax=Enterococcus columbae DSM 7374 = ATCC 51263 TaxID=1121865 RepID=S0KG49_9ENTE|nr:hypothetical protein OMW_01684 [Enterococcus columbae DSM 7374 = ATCC 51263]EOW83880.1 hypothetical protein I568_01327 [Enterococcus columbae DSM 7374 = ATCC 51263]